MKELTTDEAVALYESGFWKQMDDFDRATFQLFQDKLCMPFDVFQAAVQKALGRSVFTHEFAEPEHLRLELLKEKLAPTLEQLLALIPKAKRIIVFTGGSE